MTSPWYHITPIHPGPLVQVNGIVTMATGYDVELTIARGRPPHTNTWASFERGRVTPLQAGATPCLWQPKNPEKWKAVLPAAAAICEQLDEVDRVRKDRR